MPQEKENAAVKTRLKVKTPTLYDVWMLNDDFTTMEFVVDVLESKQADAKPLHPQKNHP